VGRPQIGDDICAIKNLGKDFSPTGDDREFEDLYVLASAALGMSILLGLRVFSAILSSAVSAAARQPW
jgi:hypothetical protein